MIDNYNKLPLGKYEELVEVCKVGGEDIAVQVAIVAILMGCTEEEVMEMPISEYADAVRRTAFLEMKPQPAAFATKCYCGGWELVAEKDPRKITTAQYVDFKTYAERQDTAGMLSCFLVPKGKRYGKDYDPGVIMEAIRGHMSVTEALGLSAFFWRGAVV